jgi:hypothetical protein
MRRSVISSPGGAVFDLHLLKEQRVKVETRLRLVAHICIVYVA